MNIYVVEDQIIHLDDLVITINQLNHNCIGHSDNSFEALEEIERLHPDVVLIDIHLHGKKQGISLAKKIKKDKDIPVIFTSSDITKSVILESAEVMPISYIIKPVQEKDLLAALILAENKNAKKETPSLAVNELFIKQRNKLIKVDINSILYAYTDTKNYCTIVTEDRKLTIRKSMIGLKQILAHDQFLQTHRSHIINWTKVESLYEGSQSIEIKGYSVPLGRKYKEEVYKRLLII